jgi:hypothetical protein
MGKGMIYIITPLQGEDWSASFSISPLPGGVRGGLKLYL